MSAAPGPPAPDPERIKQMLANPRSRVWRDEETGALLVGLNDFFVPAADAEEIPPSEVATVVAAWESRGWWGILAWVIQRRYVGAAVPVPPAGLTATYPRPQPMPDAEMPDREWTDYEWVLNQWWLANQHCELLEARLAEKAAVRPGAPPAARLAPTDAMIDAVQKEFLKAGEYEHASSTEQFRMALALKAALRAALAAQGST